MANHVGMRATWGNALIIKPSGKGLYGGDEENALDMVGGMRLLSRMRKEVQGSGVRREGT